IVVEAVALHHRILERRRAAVLAPAVLRADADDLVDLLAQRSIAIRVLVDRYGREQHERARPARHRRAEHEERNAEPRAFAAHYAIRLDVALAGSRDDRREPDVPVARVEAAGAARADGEAIETRNAETRLRDALEILRGERELHELVLAERNAFETREALLHVLPLRANDLLGAVEHERGAPRRQPRLAHEAIHDLGRGHLLHQHRRVAR